MEGSIIDATVVALQNILYCGEVVKCVESARCCIWRILAEARDVPYSDGLVHGCRDYKIILRMEEGRHDIVRVTGENGYAVTGGAIPYANGLIV